jgi:hypothetical protein
MINDLLHDVVIRRRLFVVLTAVLMVAGAVMLTVTLTLLFVKTRTTVYVPTPTTQSPGSAVADSPLEPQAVVPHTATPVAPQAIAPQRTTVRLGMKDFTAACQEQWGATATARIVRNSSEPPSYWVKCFIGRRNVGGVSLDDYCNTIKPGTRSTNPRRYDPDVAHQPWKYWECVLA